MKKILLISGSLNVGSLSIILLRKARDILIDQGFDAEILDLRNEQIPFCDARSLEAYPENIQGIYARIVQADAIIFGMPVYCYTVSGPLKNFIDIFAKAFTGKYFGVCCTAGSKLSYLATADLFKIMSFESDATGVQPLVLADASDFFDGIISNPTIISRIEKMVGSLVSKVEYSENVSKKLAKEASGENI